VLRQAQSIGQGREKPGQYPVLSFAAPGPAKVQDQVVAVNEILALAAKFASLLTSPSDLLGSV
jgi:hypothetical protein